MLVMLDIPKEMEDRLVSEAREMGFNKNKFYLEWTVDDRRKAIRYAIFARLPA